jgi:DUF1707 SHOCT-like domain/Domain of unknown function (DUF4190)
MATGAGSPGAGGGRGKLRAADVDRDRVAGLLGTAYAEGRLSKDEYDDRLETALSARTYADLDQVVTDLPVQVAAPSLGADPALVTPPRRTNGYAMASFACGVGQFMVGPLATIPAIVFGHLARSQIRRTGEQGAGLALVGLVLGWGAVILGVIALLAGLAFLARAGAPGPAQMPMPMHMR